MDPCSCPYRKLNLRVFFFPQITSANSHGILLEVVQVLMNLNLIIAKAYVSSDGDWQMDGKVWFILINITIIYFLLSPLLIYQF